MGLTFAPYSRTIFLRDACGRELRAEFGTRFAARMPA